MVPHSAWPLRTCNDHGVGRWLVPVPKRPSVLEWDEVQIRWIDVLPQNRCLRCPRGDRCGFFALVEPETAANHCGDNGFRRRFELAAPFVVTPVAQNAHSGLMSKVLLRPLFRDPFAGVGFDSFVASMTETFLLGKFLCHPVAKYVFDRGLGLCITAQGTSDSPGVGARHLVQVRRGFPQAGYSFELGGMGGGVGPGLARRVCIVAAPHHSDRSPAPLGTACPRAPDHLGHPNTRMTAGRTSTS